MKFGALGLALLVGLLVTLGLDSVRLWQAVLSVQPAGFDFVSVWTGAGVALSEPARLYDFAFVTGEQAWLIGERTLRPFVYPPSALPVFAPFALLPYWPAYGLWVLSTGALFVWAARRAGAPWWVVLFPPLTLVAVCGQITFLVGGLVTAGLTLRNRPVLAGVLFGLAAAVKPQAVLLLPVALAAELRWRSLVAAGLTALALVLVSVALWGPSAWLEWLRAVPRFEREVIFANPRLAEDAVTPYAALVRFGLNGAWAYLLAPLAAAAVWATFRATERAPERLLALFGAALLVSPYAMNYEMTLLAPAVAAFLARTDERRWLLCFLAAGIYGLAYAWCLPALAAVLALLALWPPAGLLARRLAPARA